VPAGGSAVASAKASAASLSLRQRAGIGALAAAFPDSDYIMVLVHPLAFIADWHRSITHSFVLLPVWAFLLAFILAALFRARPFRREIALVCGLSLFSHILADLITSWGTQIFAPLSGYAPAWNLTFIIDPYFSGIVALSLLLALFRGSRMAARIGLLALVLYLGMQGVLKREAQEVGREYVQHQGLPGAVIHTLPQPLSPFNWKVVVVTEADYHVALVNLLRRHVTAEIDLPLLNLRHYYRPRGQLIWTNYPRIDALPEAARVWALPALALFRKFTVLPYLYGHEQRGDETCFWYADLRFLLPELAAPFRYGLCRKHPDGTWQLYRQTGISVEETARRQVSH
jgi:inner membrane protein